MTTVHLALLLALAAPGTPARNARPRPSTDAESTSTMSSSLSDEDVAQRVRAYLGSIDTPTPAARWKALGARAVPILESVVRDPDALPSRRAKSIEALSIIGGSRAKQLVLDAARSPDEPFGVRAAALRGAPRLLVPKELASELRPILENASQAPVRATAAEVLARHGGATGCSVVRAQVDREHGHERDQFSRALDRCRTQNP